MEQLRRELDEIENGLSRASKPTYNIEPPPSKGSQICSPSDTGDHVAAKADASAPLARAPTSRDHGTEGVALQLQAAKKLRNLLSTHREVLIHEVLERNWIPRLLEWLQLDHPTIQVEALWALTNIAAGNTEHTNMLLRHDPVPVLVKLLESPHEDVLEQAIWVLGNIAGEGAASRDTVLANGALEPLVHCILQHQCSQKVLRIGSWALNNLCDPTPRPTLDIAVLMPVLLTLIQCPDSEVLSHTCWALSHLCDGPSAHIKVVVEANLCGRLVELLQHRSWRVTKPALRTIGNIVCAEDEVDYTQYILEAGAVPYLRALISHSNREIQKEACWTLSNIAAGTCDQIQTVLDSGAIPLLVELALQPPAETDAEVRSEACWVVLNATSCGSDAQIEFLVRQGCVQVLGDLLGEANMVMMALEGLERMLQVGEEEGLRSGTANPYAAMLPAGKIEELEHHRQPGIAKRASRIWKDHFVTCAICQQTFSKQAPDVRFCGECKCYVCVKCNCTVFHLSYQEELWNEMSVKEASAKEALQASKRNRKARRKQKEKEKKAKATGTGGGGGGGGKAGSGEGGGKEINDEEKMGSTTGKASVGEEREGKPGSAGSLAENEDSSSSSSEDDALAPLPRVAPPMQHSLPSSAPRRAEKREKSKATGAGVHAGADLMHSDINGGKRGRGRKDMLKEEAGSEHEKAGREDTTRKGPSAQDREDVSHTDSRNALPSNGVQAIASTSLQFPRTEVVGHESALVNGGGDGGSSKRRGRRREDARVDVTALLNTSFVPQSSHKTNKNKSVPESSAERMLVDAEERGGLGPDAKGGGGGAVGAGGGIDLVDYLQSTGSIIALSKFLDEEDEEQHDDDDGIREGGIAGGLCG